MIPIHEAIIADGEIITRGPLPVIFDDEDQGVTFMPNDRVAAFHDGRTAAPAVKFQTR
jgi:hypothetical protein